MERIEQLPDQIRRLYAIVAELEAAWPGRPFTPDGHLVGSIGEVVAAHLFDLELLPPSNKACDARTRDGLTVEIKATQRTSFALASNPDPMPDRLLALRIDKDGIVEVAYNGPAAPVWAAAGQAGQRGQRRIGLRTLEALGATVDPADRVPPVD